MIRVFGEFEVINAIEVRVFRKELSAGQAKSSFKDFEQDLRDGVLDVRSLEMFERARHLAATTTSSLGTRTAGLLHVAAALELGVEYLYSFDQQQRKLAQAVRLKLN